MISYRHHIVSLLAVFLALAVGIVLGGGPLTELGRAEPPAADAPGAQRATQQVERSAAFGDDFAAAGAATLYDGRLEGQAVSLLTLPGAARGRRRRAGRAGRGRGRHRRRHLRRAAGAGLRRGEVAGRHPGQPADDPARHGRGECRRADLRAARGAARHRPRRVRARAPRTPRRCARAWPGPSC